jgi:hypothetical protein
MDWLAECCGQISIHFCSIVRQMCTQYNGIATLSYVNKDVDCRYTCVTYSRAHGMITIYRLFFILYFSFLLFLKILFNRDSRTPVFMCKLISGLCVEVGLIQSLNSVYLFVSEWENIHSAGNLLNWIWTACVNVGVGGNYTVDTQRRRPRRRWRTVSPAYLFPLLCPYLHGWSN